MDHEFRSSLVVFDGVQEDGHPPPRVNATNIITHANPISMDCEWWVACKDDPARKTRVKRLSILFITDY
jgi:hypothetical protein